MLQSMYKMPPETLKCRAKETQEEASGIMTVTGALTGLSLVIVHASTPVGDLDTLDQPCVNSMGYTRKHHTLSLSSIHTPCPVGLPWKTVGREYP